jgi:DNA-binding MarR family transcriptional regulator
MEKTNLVKRTATEDRRYKIIVLTDKAKKLMEKVEPLYFAEVNRIMSALKQPKQKELIGMLEKVRANL